MCRQAVEVVEKRTFLEFVEVGHDEAIDGEQQLLMRRAKTEPSHWEQAVASKVAVVKQIPTVGSSSEPSSTPRSPCDSISPTSTLEVNSAESVSTSVSVDARQSALKPVTGGAGGLQHEDTRTTLMLRNLPNDYNREMFLDMLDLECLAGEYDFAYFPVDFQTGSGLGYAFVNFTSHVEALRAWQVLHGYNDWLVPSTKVCDVRWSSPVQGLKANVERYRNSPVMHHAVPDSYKPVVFTHGVRVQFPLPKKPIKCMPGQRAFNRRS
jgi:RNA recognition motif-containing protein